MHNLQDRDIQTGVKQAWHGKTNIVESITKENCGIGYDMTISPLYITKPDGELVETPHRQIVSLDDNLPIGKPVSDKYALISNTQILDMIGESLTGTRHEVVSVGTVNDRALGFYSVQLDEQFTAANRLTDSVLNILWGHGGNMALMARSGFTVVVCQNTFNAALGRKGRDMNLTIKHTKNAHQRIEGMEKAIEAYIGVAAEFKAAMNSLAEQDCTVETATRIVGGILVPDTFERDNEVSTRTKNTIDRVVNLFQTGAGNSGRNLADVFNAATDYFSHESSGGKDRMKQYVSSEFGAGNRMKQTFFDVLTNESEVARVTSRGEKVLLALNN